jgi:hypothetical protein
MLSPWQKLLELQNNQAFITMIGFDADSFDRFFLMFGPMFSGHMSFDESGTIVKFEYTRCQKRKVQPEDSLWLVLLWMQTRGSLNVLQLVFGLTYTNLSMYLRFGVRLFVKTFRDNPLARVSIPSAKEIKSFKEAFAAQHPLLTHCWASMDGLKLFLQQSGNAEIQEHYYNGWMHDHYVTSKFCFFPDGTIPIAFFDVPGLVHNSQVAEYGNIYGKLEDVFQLAGAKCCVDLAFGQVNREYLHKLSQDLFDSSALTRQERKLRLRKKGRQHWHNRQLSGGCA